MSEHLVRVTEFLTGAETHKGGTFQARCSICGDVGPGCDYSTDAQAIASRHAEAQGFESKVAPR